MYSRLLELMEENKITPYRLSKETGITQATLSRWKTGKTEPSIETLQKIADHFHVSLDYLLGNVNDPFFHLDNERILREINCYGDEQEQSVKLESKLPPNATPINFNELTRIPILGRIAAGKPLYAVENIEGYTYTDLNEGAEYFALRVKGDSMNAMRIFDNDIVIVRRQCVVEDGEVAVVIVDHEDATMKRFYRTGSTVTLLPQSNNPEHNPQIYDLTKTNIEIIGKVVKVEFML